MALIEIKTPDGRAIRQHHASLEAARASLTAGYAVVGKVFLPDADGNGGFVVRPGGPTLLSVLLHEHGAELLAWMRSHGMEVRDVQYPPPGWVVTGRFPLDDAEPLVIEFLSKRQEPTK
jgi:hypothetical protein